MVAKRASVLVTGGAGYVGSHTVLALLEAGHSVVVLDNLSTGNRWAVDPRAAFFEGGIENDSLVSTIMELHRVHAVVHLAGAYRTAGDDADPLRFYRINTSATEALVESVVACGVKHFVYSGTAEAYRLPAPTPIPENWGLAPNSAYAASIFVTEQILSDASAAHPFNCGVLRYFNAVAADPLKRCGPARSALRSDRDQLIRQAIAVVLGLRDHAEIVGSGHATPDGSLVRDYVHVSDVATAHVALLAGLIAEPTRNRAYNCGYGTGWSDLAVLDAVERVTNVRVPRREFTAPPGLPGALVADPTLLRNELGWQPAYANLDTLVRDTYRWEMHLPRHRSGEGEAGPIVKNDVPRMHFINKKPQARAAEPRIVTRRAAPRASRVTSEP